MTCYPSRFRTLGEPPRRRSVSRFTLPLALFAFFISAAPTAIASRVPPDTSTVNQRVAGQALGPARHALLSTDFEVRPSRGAIARHASPISFQATPGEIISALMTDSTGSGTWGIESAAGTVIAQESFGSGTTFLDRVTIPAPGKYDLFATLDSGQSGTFDLKLFRVKDVYEQIQESTKKPGSPLDVKTTVPGQDAYLTFHGIAGQTVFVTLANARSNYTGMLEGPDHTQLWSPHQYGTGNAFFDRTSLPDTGRYRIGLLHQGSTTIDVKVTVFVDADITGTIKQSSTMPGSPVIVKTTVPGQDVNLSFHGIAGQHVSATFTRSSIGAFTAVLETPDNTQLNGGFFFGSSNFIDRTALPATGMYHLRILESNGDTGSVTVTVYGLVDRHQSIAPNGGAVSVTLSVPGQNVRLTFHGKPGNGINIHEFSSSLAAGHVVVHAPDGTTVGNSYIQIGSGDLNGIPLTQAGTYDIEVVHDGDPTGTVTVSLKEHRLKQPGAVNASGIKHS